MSFNPGAAQRPVDQDARGRTLRVGDPVTLVGPIVGKRYGSRCQGTVRSFGRVNVRVHIEDAGMEDLIGTVVPVRGENLKYGHVRWEEEVAAAREQEEREMIAKGRRQAVAELQDLLELAHERGIITPEQLRQIYALSAETHPQIEWPLPPGV